MIRSKSGNWVFHFPLFLMGMIEPRTIQSSDGLLAWSTTYKAPLCCYLSHLIWIICTTLIFYFLQQPIIPKPKFLEALENYVHKEIITLNCSDPKPSELRLQAYREVFEYLIGDFKTYRPLLSQVKFLQFSSFDCIQSFAWVPDWLYIF